MGREDHEYRPELEGKMEHQKEWHDNGVAGDDTIRKRAWNKTGPKGRAGDGAWRRWN